MKNYSVDKIRNVVLLGHGSSGKTTLTEAMLYLTKVTNRMGKVEEGNTVSDFDKEEIARGFTIGTSIVPIEWNGVKLNFIDTPGYVDFEAEVYSGVKVAGGAVIMVDASSGIEVGTEKAWRITEEQNIPKIIFVNKMNRENIDYDTLIQSLKEKFGNKIAPFCIPTATGEGFKGFINAVEMKGRELKGDKCEDVDIPGGFEDEIAKIREMLTESVAESDESLLEKFFEGEEFTDEEFRNGLRNGIISGNVVPVLCGSVDGKIGVETLMNTIVKYFPVPTEVNDGVAKGVNPDDDKEVTRKLSPSEPFSAYVFKTISDAFVGKISLFKVMSGVAKKDMEVLNANKDEKEKLAAVFYMRGKEQINTEEITSGDIGATARLQVTETGNTLCDKDHPIKYEPAEIPKPELFVSIEPKSKGDEEKISSSLAKIKDEDPAFELTRNAETRQTLLIGQGSMQIQVLIAKLKNNFGVDVVLGDPKVSYRETIKGKATVQGKHKKQSGGAGQYGDVHITFEPCYDQDFVFEEKIFGGSVPKQYIPAVEKGLIEAKETGVLAGCPVVNFKATLIDGSYHDVDSNEMAFKIAASLAFKKGMEEAKPVLLEPIMKVEIFIPEDYMGDIMGDMNRRRGRILGMEPARGMQKVMAEAPQSEMFSYATDLRSMTQARGRFTMEVDRYEEVPPHIADKVVETLKQEKENA